jgi:hypothetical protein
MDNIREGSEIKLGEIVRSGKSGAQREDAGRGLETRLARWSESREQFAKSMTLTAEVRIDGAPADSRELLVAAYAGDEVRGVGWTQDLENSDRDLVFLMIYGDEPQEEPLSLRVYDAIDERTYGANEVIPFETDGILGSPADPFVITVGAIGARTELAEDLPTEFTLRQNYPNPFNPTTTIRYELPAAAHVEIVLFDVLGREVRRLVDADRKAGRYDVVVNAADLASGMYVYRIAAGDYRNLRKMMVVK